MKTRIHYIAAALTVLIGASVSAWSQRKQTDNPRTTCGISEPSQSIASIGEVFAQIARAAGYADKAKADASDAIAVVGHLSLDKLVVSNIRMTEDQIKPLLELTDKTHETIELVDVADPLRPKVVQRMPKPAELRNSRVELEVGYIALFAEAQYTAQQPPKTISIVSFADPENPQIVRTFASVTAMSVDHSRGIIYLTNPEGLWILRAHSRADEIAVQRQYDEILRSAFTP